MLVVVGLVLGLLVGCAKDDGAAVRSDGGSGSSAAGGSSAAAGSSAAGGSSAAPADCKPVGEDLEAKADQTVEVVLKDYSFDPSEIEVPAGITTFAVKNEGDTNHELAFLPGGGAVPMKDGHPDEAALEEAGAFELEGFGPGQTCNGTWDLEPGTYTMFCIIELDDGTTHYMKGMQGTLKVT
ncbi:MAG: cupredoxin domain-containing protein [Acidimicrobiales bacterium]